MAEMMVNAKVASISNKLEYVTFTTLADRDQASRDIVISGRQNVGTAFDVDSKNNILYKGTTTIVKVGDRVTLYVPSLKSNAIVQVMPNLQGEEPYCPSLVKDADFDNKLQLGNCLFYVPPTSIQVDKISTTQRIPTIRTKGSIKSQTGHTDTKVTLTLFFPTVQTINDPENGLIGLIAQFMRTPFVPVINNYLNSVYQIESVCLQDLTVNTVPNFPKSLEAQVTLLVFEHMVFMPQEPWFVETIDADLFRWYYKRGLADGDSQKKQLLRPMKRNDSSISFGIVPEELLKQAKATRQANADKLTQLGDDVNSLFMKAKHDYELFTKVMEVIPKFEKGYNPYLKGRENEITFEPIVQEEFDILWNNRFWAGDYSINLLMEHPDNRALANQKWYLGDVYGWIGTLSRWYGEGWIHINKTGQVEKKWSKSYEELKKLVEATYNKAKQDVDKQQDLVSSLNGKDLLSKMVTAPIKYEDIIVTDVNVSYQNAFARLPLQEYERPAFQFLGTQDCYIKISMEVLSDEALKGLQDLYTYCQTCAREYRFDMVSSFLAIRNELMQLFGVEYGLIDSITCSTVPNFPGHYFVEMTVMDFNVSQKSREYGDMITNTGETPVLRSYPDANDPRSWRPGAVLSFNPNDTSKNNEKLYWTKLDSIFGQINLYPDLDLPTYDEVDAFLKTIGRKPYPRPKTVRYVNEKKVEFSIAGKYVNPDFYFSPNSDLKSVVKTVADIKPELKIYADKTIVVTKGKRLSNFSESKKKKLPYTTKQNPNPFLYNPLLDEPYKKLGFKAYAIQKTFDPIGEAPDGTVISSLTEAGDWLEHKQTDDRKKYFAKPRAMGFGPEGQRPGNELWSDEWTDQTTYDATGTMARAFPTAHMFLINEGTRIGWYKLWDNFYGTNALSSIEICKSRKNATDTVFLSISNTYHHYTDRKIAMKLPNFTLKRFLQLGFDLEMRESHTQIRDHIGLFPGVRLHLRIGYGNNLAELPVQFNGTVTEVSVGDIVQIIAQSDALELTNTFGYQKDFVAGKLCQGEGPATILQKLLVRGDAQGIARGWQAITSNWLYNNANGVIHFGYPNFYFGLNAGGEIVQNIYPGNGTGLLPFLWGGSIGEQGEQNCQIVLSDKNIWETAQLLAMYVPNYIAAAHPFELRSTLFYGKPHWDLTYGYEFSPTAKPGFVDARTIPSPLDNSFKEMGYYISAKRKPFRQWHVYSSFGHIIDNKIKATAEGMYQNVIAIEAIDDVMSTTNKKKERTQTAYADKDIYAHIQHTTSVNSELYAKKPLPFLGFISGSFEWIWRELGTDGTAQNLAMSTVRDYMKDMYQGEILIMGDPTVKPHDAMYLSDTYNEMFGTCFVKQVVHQFSLDTGFITSVSPDCAVGVIEDEFSDLLTWGTSVAAGAATNWALLSKGAGSFRGALFRKTAGLIGKASRGLTFAAEKIATKVGQRVATRMFWTTAADSAIASLESTALAAEMATPPGWVILAIEVALMLGYKILTKNLEEKLKESQCVVCNFLTLKGVEFSAGVNGHQGITIGSIDGAEKLGYWQRLVQLLPPFVQDIFGLKNPILNPKMLYGNTTTSTALGLGKIPPDRPFTKNDESGFVWPVTGSINNVYGDRDISDKLAIATRYHQGIDIGAVLKTPIVAANSGTITYVWEDWAKHPAGTSPYDSGIYVKIQHDNGFNTTYCHLNSVAMVTDTKTKKKRKIKVGDKVKKGDIIGYCGSTGASTGPHLHFMVRLGGNNGTIVDPLVYLPARTFPHAADVLYDEILGIWYNKK